MDEFVINNDQTNIVKKKLIFKKCIKWIIFAVCILSLVSLIIIVKLKTTLNIDKIVYNYIYNVLKSSNSVDVAIVITNLANKYWLIIVSIVFILLLKDKKMGFIILLNLTLAAISNHTLKQIIRRQRPNENCLVLEKGFSMPSGHSMVGMAFYGFLIYIIFKRVNNKFIKYSLITLLSLLIISIGISRIYLGVHYFSDVIAGFLFAISYLIVFITIINKYVKI